MTRFSLLLAALAAVVAPALAQDNTARTSGIATTTNIWAGVYTEAQAAQGERIYASACSSCHGKALEGDPDQGFPALASPGFMVEWDGQTVADLVRHIHTAPNDNPADMDPDTAVAMTALILNMNGVPPGNVPLSTDAKDQAKILITENKPS